MPRTVAYTATTRHLFQTIASAVQARQHVNCDTQVCVVVLTELGLDQPDLALLSNVAAAHNISLYFVGLDVLEGLHPMFGRLFLDRMLPKEVDKILYLDGDTQIRGSLEPLLDRPLGYGRLAAVMDPMIAVRYGHAGLRGRIDRAWDTADLPNAARLRYVNSGVLLFHRSDLMSFRARTLSAYAQHGATFTHADQDAINRALWMDVDHLQLEWNFPGFLLGVNCAARDDARVIHFMSSPRPWHGSYLPWGSQGYRPYADLVRRHPELRPHWERPKVVRNIRNHAQQLFKACSEGKVWRSADFAASLDLVYPDRLSTPSILPLPLPGQRRG